MQKFKSNITTTTGAAIRNVPVFVLTQSGAIASIFLDRAGAVAAPNPLSTDSQGVFYFYAVNGRYSLRTTVEGVTVTDDDVVLMNDPEELATAGPIAEAVAAAQAAAQQAQDAVEESGIPELVAAAQNAVVDANNAVSQAQAAASLANTAKNESAANKAASEAALSGAQTASSQAAQEKADAQTAAAAAAQSAASIDPNYLRNRANHTGTQAIATVSGLQGALDAKASSASVAQAIAMAATFTVAPATYQAFLIVVTLPHVRLMQWNGTKYVRSPIGQMPGVLFHSDGPAANVTHAIQVRSDVVYNTADHPDLAEFYGFVGPTFVLKEGRARVLRAADLGAGIDASLVNGALHGDAGRNLTSTVLTGSGGSAFQGFVPSTEGAMYTTPWGGPKVGLLDSAVGDLPPGSERHGYLNLDVSRQWPTASEFRVKTLTGTIYVTR